MTVLLLGVKNPLHSGIKSSENAINSQGYTICRRRCRAGGSIESSRCRRRNQQQLLCGLSSVLRNTKEGDQKSTMEKLERYIDDTYQFYNSPEWNKSGSNSGIEVKLMNSILRLNPIALWEGAGS